MPVGTGPLTYEYVENWLKIPSDWTLGDVPGVAVDASDNVYLFTRGDHPVIVADRDGNVIRTWGEGGTFTTRTHGINVAPDGSIWCADDGKHTIRKFTPEGRLLLTLGVDGKPAPKFGGKPFNRPTHMAVSPRSGEIFVTDGYGNACVHRYSPDGQHILTWGEPGIQPGQFMRPHNVVIDRYENIFVADREAHRVQVFDVNGRLQAVWQNIHRPDGFCMDEEGNFYVGELCPIEGLVDDWPNIGSRVTIYNTQGKLISTVGEDGEGAGQFLAPHGVAVDSRGDMYVGEVSFTMRGSRENPQRQPRSFQKYARVR